MNSETFVCIDTDYGGLEYSFRFFPKNVNNKICFDIKNYPLKYSHEELYDYDYQPLLKELYG